MPYRQHRKNKLLQGNWHIAKRSWNKTLDWLKTLKYSVRKETQEKKVVSDLIQQYVGEKGNANTFNHRKRGKSKNGGANGNRNNNDQSSGNDNKDPCSNKNSSFCKCKNCRKCYTGQCN